MIPSASEWQSLPIKDLPIEVIDGDRSDKYPKRSEFTSSGVPLSSIISFSLRMGISSPRKSLIKSRKAGCSEVIFLLRLEVMGLGKRPSSMDDFRRR
jgi:hypothetical protein